MHRTKMTHASGLPGLMLAMTLTIGLPIGLLSGCKPDGAKKTPPGHELYEACKSCHGSAGFGQENIAAPAIAGLPVWYVEAQLMKFRTGVRGAHPDDYEGLRMRPMSMQMYDMAEVKEVSAYVASMAPLKQGSNVEGDATAGAASYAVCTACHGPDGKGNKALNAPPIAGQHGWYLVSQLKKFKSGIRGTNPRDVTGAQMRPMSMTLADEQAMKNVVAHISTLAK
jgi:cytochrome c553